MEAACTHEVIMMLVITVHLSGCRSAWLLVPSLINGGSSPSSGSLPP